MRGEIINKNNHSTSTMQRTIATGLGIGYLLLIAAAIAFASPQKKNDKALLHCLNLHPAKYCFLTYGNQP
jgi:hypothetical protein